MTAPLKLHSKDPAFATKCARASGKRFAQRHRSGRSQEECYPQGGKRGLSIQAARRLARQLREAEWAMHETAAARASLSRAVPFDPHALVPVPGAILRLGPDDPEALRWPWAHWGTT